MLLNVYLDRAAAKITYSSPEDLSQSLKAVKKGAS
jgi:hypothetical protein